MTRTRVALSVPVIVSLFLAACQAQPADVQQDESAVRQVFDLYIKSINAADGTLAADVWLQSPDTLAITPLGRFQGWDRIRDEIYVKFLQGMFSERDLRPSDVLMRVKGDSAWLAFDWTFSAKLTNGQPIASKGWESHMYEKTEKGWRIVHLHYSVPPPPMSPPSTP